MIYAACWICAYIQLHMQIQIKSASAMPRQMQIQMQMQTQMQMGIQMEMQTQAGVVYGLGLMISEKYRFWISGMQNYYLSLEKLCHQVIFQRF